jgi:enediyne biosynthesis protein E4
MRNILNYALLFYCTGIVYSQGNVSFTEISKQAGINFKYTFGDNHYENILESSGSGITIFDYNNDGFYDVYMLNGTYLEGISSADGKKFSGSYNRLYKNNGNGTFTDVSLSSGLADKNWSMAAVAIDLNNDGFEDIFLLNYGPNVFYLNNGNGTFSDITEKIGLQGPEKLNGFTKWSIGAVFSDFNKDNLIDVMVGNFLAFDPAYKSPANPNIMPHPSEYKGQASMLYLQQPDGKFTDVTQKYNLFYPDSKCMGLTVFDYDSDGDQDIFQANDHQLNYLFRNDGDKFSEVGVASGVAANFQGLGSGSMHGTIGDADNDGLIDIFITDLEFGALYKNIGNGLFKDVSQTSGITAIFTGVDAWGTAFIDYDNDGALDIISANGIAEELVLQYPLLLENDGKGNFKNVGKKHGAYFSEKRSGRGLAIFDFDNDGDMDIIISHVDLKATPVLLRNDGGNKNNWIGFSLKGKSGPVTAIGAKVIVKYDDKRRVFINQPATGYLSNSDPRIHIGLGKCKKIDEIEIIWTDGSKEIIKYIEPNQYYTLLQGKGIVH